MIDTTVVSTITFGGAMFLAALAVTAYEFRRLSNPQDRRSLLAPRKAPEMRPARAQAWPAR